jgi:multisubunit Na+/H+ antiporter MnhB subunit
MHWLFIYIVWMVYILLAMGVLEAASDRTQDLRGARTALVVGAVLGAGLTLTTLWFGPIDPFA